MANDSLFTTGNALNAAQLGLGAAQTFIPGGKYARAAMDVGSVGLSYAQGSHEAHIMSDEEYKQLSAMLEADLRQEAKHSRSLKGALGKMREHYSHRPMAVAISAVGMIAGGVLGTLVAPVVGTIGGLIIGGIGGMAGGYIADRAFEFFFPRKHETPVEVASQLRAKQMNGQAVTAEEAFVTLAGSLRHKDKEKIREDLHKLTGYRSMGAALEAGEHAALRKLMRKYDNFIRAETGLLTDMNNPEMTASKQYAQAINAGQLDARFLLFHDRLPVEVNIPAMEQYTGMGHLPSPELPGNHRGGPALG